MIRQTVASSIRELGDDQVEVILSTRTLARDQNILEPMGCQLDDYKKNPVVLFSHDPKMPVGTASAITVNKDRITARVTFAPRGVSAIADEVRGLVKAGIIRSLSVGFDPREGSPIDPQRPRGGQHISRWLLLEASFVAIPADVGSVVTQRAHRSADMNSKIIRADEAIAEAQRHHWDLRRALEKEQLGRAMECHRNIGRCLDTAERCLRGLSDDGTELELQVSAGLSSGKSGGGRSAGFRRRQGDVVLLFPSAAERAVKVAELAPKAPAAGRSLVHWTHDMRQYLESEALARAKVTPGPAYDYSRAMRQAELARLTRRD